MEPDRREAREQPVPEEKLERQDRQGRQVEPEVPGRVVPQELLGHWEVPDLRELQDYKAVADRRDRRVKQAQPEVQA